MSPARSLAWAGALGIHALLLGGSLLVPAPRPELHTPVPPVRVTLARAPSAPPSSPREVRPSVPSSGAAPALADEGAAIIEPAAVTEPEAPVAADSPTVTPAGLPEPLADPSPSAAPDYPRLVREAIASRQAYPPAARARRQEGTVVLSFSVGPGGTLVDGPEVVRSSSYPRLDDAAVEAVRAAAPFASPPAGSGPWVFELPLEFRLARG